MSDKKIKKFWLVILLLKTIFPVLLPPFLSKYFLAYPAFSQHEHAMELLGKYSPPLAFLGLGIGLGLAAILYYCAYVKPGIFLLTGGLISALWSIPQSFFSLGKLQACKQFVHAHDQNPYLLQGIFFIQCLFITFLVLDLFWVYFSFKLRKINLAQRKSFSIS